MSRLLCPSLLLLLLTGGCKDDGPRVVPEEKAAETSAETECRLLFGCECDHLVYADEADCVESRKAEYNSLHNPILQMGLTYDGECLAFQLDALQDLGCALPDSSGEATEETCMTFCSVYHGAAQLGETCSFYSIDQTYSDCDQGLICYASKCEDPCEVIDEGAADLKLGMGEPCQDGFEVLGECDEGLACDSGGSDTCIELPGEGAPCLNDECADGFWCQTVITESTCVAQFTDGETCANSEECRSGYCGGSTCAKMPALGESCFNDCEEGLYCIGGVCSEGPGLDEQCFGGSHCAPGLVCEANFCRLPPPIICSQLTV